jgi:hypothetical protein
MDVSEAKRLRQLEDENAKLKKLLAEQMLDAAALRELLSKMYDPPRPCKGPFRLKTMQSAKMYPASCKWAAVAARP